MIVFYSWQSWLPNKTNRSFIEKALEKALKCLEKREVFLKLNPALDRDTQNMLGSPDIIKAIFDKIRECDVFVADVTPVITDEKGHQIPNPNVLTELGFAASELGWDRVICLLNTAYGEVESLPFDIDKHRVMLYRVDINATQQQRREQLEELIKQLCKALQHLKNRSLPDVEYLDKILIHPLYPLRTQIPVALWSSNKVKSAEHEEFLFNLFDGIATYADEVSNNILPNLMVDKSHALTTRQKIRCRQIIEITRSISTRLSLIIMDFERYNEASRINNNQAYSMSDWLNLLTGVLKKFYEESWKYSFDNFDNKHRPNVDDYLYGKKHQSAEDIKKRREALWQMMGKRYSSREDFEETMNEVDDNISNNIPINFDETFAYGAIRRAYPKELFREVWNFIQVLKT